MYPVVLKKNVAIFDPRENNFDGGPKHDVTYRF